MFDVGLAIASDNNAMQKLQTSNSCDLQIVLVFPASDCCVKRNVGGDLQLLLDPFVALVLCLAYIITS